MKLTNLITGDSWRKSRLHDMRGNFIGARAMLTDLPRSLAGAALREALHKYPALPWIPYPAISAIANLASPDWRVFEHGAGMSTLWWADRVAHIDAIEANDLWFRKISNELSRRGLRNVNLEHRTGEAYEDFSTFPLNSYDMVVIDGHAREKAAAVALRLVRRPGWIYLDNTDFAAEWQAMYGEAEDILLTQCQSEAAAFTYFTGLAPATFVASQGLLISVPGPAS